MNAAYTQVRPTRCSGVSGASSTLASLGAGGASVPASSGWPMKSARNGVRGLACRIDWLIRSTEKSAITSVSSVDAQTSAK